MRISLTARDTNTKLIPWLGHELQHAVEVAEHADITSPESLAMYFAVYETSGSRGAFESAAAQDVQRRIAAELGRRPTLAGPHHLTQAGRLQRRRYPVTLALCAAIVLVESFTSTSERCEQGCRTYMHRSLLAPVNLAHRAWRRNLLIE
ncbi:MAG TPA: hypothetical protein VKE51_09140 [Vicinamibacterales bacterium]|nr:hypothetical protein [Vicinamibacterales bacterium]